MNRKLGSATKEQDVTAFNILDWPYPLKLPTPTFRNPIVLYCILLCWSRDHFVYVLTNMRKYCDGGDDVISATSELHVLLVGITLNIAMCGPVI